MTLINGYHTSTKTQNQVQGRLLLDVVIRQGTSILQLFSCNTLIRLLLQQKCIVLCFFKKQYLQKSIAVGPVESLKTSLRTKNINKSELQDKTKTFFVLDFSLYIFNCIGSFNFQSYCLSSQCLHENLHLVKLVKPSIGI